MIVGTAMAQSTSSGLFLEQVSLIYSVLSISGAYTAILAGAVLAAVARTSAAAVASRSTGAGHFVDLKV